VKFQKKSILTSGVVLLCWILLTSLNIRAGFSWWGAWGPAIGVGDGSKGVALPHNPPPKKKIPENIFFRANIM